MFNNVPKVGGRRGQENLGRGKEQWRGDEQGAEEKRRVVTHRKERAMDHGVRRRKRQWARIRGGEGKTD